MMQLEGRKHLLLGDAKAPVSCFAYPNKRRCLVPARCQVALLPS